MLELLWPIVVLAAARAPVEPPPGSPAPPPPAPPPLQGRVLWEYDTGS
jgi:hypothetical protein